MEDKSLIKFLEMLDTEMAQHMLADLRDDTKRSEKLYNAIDKLLSRHKFQVSKLTPDVNILGGLAEGLDDYKKMVGNDGLNEEDLYGPTH